MDVRYIGASRGLKKASVPSDHLRFGRSVAGRKERQHARICCGRSSESRTLLERLFNKTIETFIRRDLLETKRTICVPTIPSQKREILLMGCSS